MSNEEKAELNYLLTKLRCQIQEFVAKSNFDMSPFIEMKYEKLIEEINDIMQLSILEGGEKND
jgi:hypothetical protein